MDVDVDVREDAAVGVAVDVCLDVYWETGSESLHSFHDAVTTRQSRVLCCLRQPIPRLLLAWFPIQLLDSLLPMHGWERYAAVVAASLGLSWDQLFVAVGSLHFVHRVSYWEATRMMVLVVNGMEKLRSLETQETTETQESCILVPRPRTKGIPKTMV